MQTLYIDVYFLINFSIDSLAMYFASRLAFHRIHPVRLLLSCALLSLVACLHLLFLEERIFGYFVLALTYIFATGICARGGGIGKWIRLSFAFLFISFLIGGVVFWGYEKLGEIIERTNIEIKYGAENNRMLVFALLILCAICALKLLISLLERRQSLQCATLSFSFLGKKYEVEALVDSGCFVIEPLSGRAVFLVKKSVFSRCALPPFRDEYKEDDWEWKSKMRLIPTRSLGGEKTLVGYLCENVQITLKHKTVSVTLYLALDEEGGSFGGYSALVPSSVLNYA